ncbi:MAG: serine hydrolase domain-containing protein [Bacteroidota bacterium]
MILYFLFLYIGTQPGFAQSNQIYHPPYFADTNRLQKIQPFFPIIEQLYRTHAEKNHFPGYIFGIVLDGKLVFSGNGGYLDIIKKNPVASQSMFRIASMSKSFTAMAIVKLRDEGKLRLDDTIEKYIPELKGQKLTQDAPALTIRDLLTHSGGFPQDDPWGDRQLADTEGELLSLIKKRLSFSSVTGLQYEYSNLGFTMLGYIIHKVSGKPYSQYITEHIWKPLGMNEAEWEYSKVPVSSLAKGHRWINNNWKDEPLLHNGIYGSMGGMITSLSSFSKYMALHMNAWPASHEMETGPVKRSSIREMQQPQRFSSLNSQYRYADGRLCAMVTAYGYGLRWSKDCEGRTTVGHSGGLPGFGSNWVIAPDYGIGVVSFANVTYASTAGINAQVLDTLMRGAGLKPRVLPASDILKNVQQRLIAFLPNWNNAGASTLFADNFFDDYPITSLKDETRKIFDVTGKIISVGDMIPENQLRGTCILQCEKGRIQVFFTLTPENPAKIQEYRIRKLD